MTVGQGLQGDMAAAKPRGMPEGLREIFAGSTAAFVSIPLGLAIGTLAYAPLGPEYVNDGARAGLLAGALGGLLVALLQTRSFVVSTTSSATGLILAAFATQLTGRIGVSPDAAAVLIAVLIVASGLITVLLGILGLGRAVAFTPQPIFAGFVSGVGILILLSQSPKLLGFGRWSDLLGWIAGFDAAQLPRIAFGCLLVGAMLWLSRIRPTLPHIAIGFVVGTLVHHAIAAIWPALPLSPMIGAMPAFGFEDGRILGRLAEPRVRAELAAHWQLVVATAIPLALVLSLESMMARRLAESLADMPRAPMRNLAATGLGTVLSGAVGGVVVSGSPAQVLALFRAGGRTRLAAATVGAVLLILALGIPEFTGLVPTMIPSAVLLVIGVRLIDAGFLGRLRGAWRLPESEARRRAFFDLAIFTVVMLPTAMGEIIIGVALGIALSVGVFLVRMGRPVVRRRSYGDTRVSKRVRCTADADRLSRHGGETLILELEGVLFFGNADDLAQVLGRAASRCRQVVLDMRRITDIDSTGASILAQAVDRARQKGCEVALCSVGAMHRVLYAADVARLRVLPDLDSALEWAEDRLLARHGGAPAETASMPLEAIDMCADLPPEDLAILRDHLTVVRYEAGQALCHAGEPADRLWILTSGSVSIRADAQSSRRIIALGPGTTVGEMALIEGGVRSATAFADERVEAMLLTAEHFDMLLRDHPQLANRMMHNLARELVRRLRNSTKDLARGD